MLESEGTRKSRRDRHSQRREVQLSLRERFTRTIVKISSNRIKFRDTNIMDSGSTSCGHVARLKRFSRNVKLEGSVTRPAECPQEL